MKKRAKNRNDDDDNGFAQWGGYMAAKKAKLENQFLYQIDKEGGERSDIFQGVSIFVNGYTKPTAEHLKRIMLMHGGVYHHYESSNTTHVIASNLPDCKVKQLKTLNVVKPSWITDSLKAGTLLDYKKYLLYSNQSNKQPQLKFGSRNLMSVSEDLDQKGTIISKEETRGERLNIDSITFQDKKKNAASELPLCQEQQLKLYSNTINLTSELKKRVNSEHAGALLSGNNVRESSIPTKETNALIDEQNGTEKNLVQEYSSPEKNIKSSESKSPHNSKCTASDPRFLSEFYGNSRLHHLSTMGAMFKEYISQLREKNTGDFPGLKNLIQWKKEQTISSHGVDDDDDDDLINVDIMEDSHTGVNLSGKKNGRTIIHVDMDCFFVSVGLRERPELRNLPVAVTHAKGNSAQQREGANRQFERDFYNQRFQNRMKKHGNPEGIEVERKSRINEIGETDSLAEIASCNYEARKAGVRNGMFFGAALKLCPDLHTIPYDFEGYKEVSYKLYDILASFTLNIEAVSCDEMYVDCTDVMRKSKTTALEFASFLRREIQAATCCCASVGIGSNPLQARLATKKAKPNGQFLLLPHEVDRFMQGVAIEDLPGVGHSLAYRLRCEGVRTCKDLQSLSLQFLQKRFGQKTGLALYKHAKGEDSRSLDTCHQRKSVSAEVNYGIRFSNKAEADTFLRQLSEEVAQRLNRCCTRGKQITLKLMVRAKDAPVETAKYMGHGACDSISRSVTLGSPTDDPNIIYREVLVLGKQVNASPSDLRGVGIQMSRLTKVSTKNKSLPEFLSERISTTEQLTKTGNLEAKEMRGNAEGLHSENLGPEKDMSTFVLVNEGKRKCSTDMEVPKDRRKSTFECSSDLKIGGSGLNKLKIAIEKPKQELKYSTKITMEYKEDNIPLINPPFEVPIMTLTQARKLVRSWILHEHIPKECDILMFAYHMQRLVVSRHLEELDILFSLVHRMLQNRSKHWKTTYRSIVEHTQRVMRVVYGSDLKVPEFID